MLTVFEPITGCRDTMEKTMVINPLPQPLAVGGDTCGKPGTFVILKSSGGVSYSWSPVTDLDNPNIPNPKATPSINTTYTVTVTDANGCVNSTSALVIIYQKPPEIHWDTTIVIGEEVKLDVAMGPGYTYVWKPSDALSCTTCPNPIAEPHVDMNYFVDISDTIGCFTTTSTYDFIIKPVTSIDVPEAFTPNGDQVNDLIFVRGWGIKKLIEFKIFNRFGQMIFETSDIETGWDGFFNGELQNMETYTYIAKVETWVQNSVLTKQGSFNLLR
jgi:gliding motility-associated-like protein